MLPITKIFEKKNAEEQSNLLNEYFLALIIDNKTVKSGIWKFTGQEGELLSSGSLENWGTSVEELIVASDASCASAVAKLPEISGKQPSKVLLGLSQSWMDKESLKKEEANILQAVCKKLVIKPMGFVVTPEAVSNLLKKEEGGLPSVILVSVHDTEIEVSLVVQGKYLGSESVDRSENLPSDLKEGLQRFDYLGNLPSRILLIGGNNLEESRQRLIAYPWVSQSGEEKLSFLQLPKIDIAEEDFCLSAVILGGSQELTKQKTPVQEDIKQEIEKEADEEIPVIEEKIEPKIEEGKVESFPKMSFGFIENEDISKTIKEDNLTPLETDNEAEIQENIILPQADNFSYVVPEEKLPPKQKFVLMTSFFKKIFSNKRRQKPVSNVLDNEREEVRFERKFRSRKFPVNIFLNRFTVFLLLIITIGGLGLGFLWWKIVKAEVKLMVKPLKIEKQFDFTASSQAAAVDYAKTILPAIEGKMDLSGEKTVEVKGKKTVGDKATGEVVIYNRTDKVKTLPKKTIIKGPGGLNFVLKDEIKIASKTADFVSRVDKWGEAKANIEASSIGPQYNLSADSNLSFEGIAAGDLLVKNLSAFSGGTSREIQAVSKEDKNNLQKLLIAELTQNAQKEIAGKISSSNHLLENSLQIKTRSSAFDHEENDEVPSLALEINASFSYLYFKNSDLDVLIEKSISSVPEGFQKEPFENTQNLEIKDKNKNIYTVKINRKYNPLINLEEISKKIKAKKLDFAKTYFKEVNPSITGYDILITPPVFAKFKLFPLTSENIKIVIEPTE